MTETAKTKPRVSLGLLTFGPEGSETYGSRITSLDTFNQCLDYLQSRGYNEVDTARTYVGGQQEGWTKLTNWRERNLTLATKWYPYKPGNHSKAIVKENLNKSLGELGSDSVDIFYLHAPDRSVPFQETLEACNELYQEGKFKKLGLSNYAAWEVAELCTIADQKGWAKPSVYQAMYNCLTRAIEEELVPCCRKFGMDILVYNPLAGGVLSGRYKSKEIPADGGRYSTQDPVIGAMYRDRYFKDVNFEALKVIQPVADKLGLTLLEIAFRWLVHHSKLKVMDGNDGLVIGISSLSQLQSNLDNVEKGPLPEEVLENGCFDASFPGGSCTNDPACMCTQKKYREAYFCCMAKKCDADVMPESVERQHTECQARNLDFTFDAEKVCGMKSEGTSTCSLSSTTRNTKTTSHVSHGPSATSSPAATTSEPETTSSTKGAESASSTAQKSSTGGAAPATDSASRLGASLGAMSMLFTVVGMLL
ncbi:oxidoreductase [Fusarium proliferatum]|uniref:Oxidoreductase n=1 Tax=Gibberella intermedia TaxID=948311 RepID=A0A365NBB9_GIBIN|nr:oxidoreductase [Fusarium proliferatum]